MNAMRRKQKGPVQKTLNRMTGVPLFLSLLLCLNGCDQVEAPRPPNPTSSASASSLPNDPPRQVDLSFGVYTSDKPSTMYKKFKPLLVGLETRIAAHLNRPTSIRLRVFKTYALARQALVDGKVDLARFGPASYVIAHRANPKIQLLAIEQRKGKLKFYGNIVVLDKSPIKKVEDLKGHTFAFGDKTSTIGRYLAQLTMMKSGVQMKDLKGHEYLGRHDKVVAAVALGQFDAGAAKASTVKKHKGKALRVINKFENVTKPWVAASTLETKTVTALRKALLGTTEKQQLKPLSKSATGFSPPNDKLYDVIRQAIDQSKAFEGPK